MIAIVVVERNIFHCFSDLGDIQSWLGTINESNSWSECFSDLGTVLSKYGTSSQSTQHSNTTETAVL